MTPVEKVFGTMDFGECLAAVRGGDIASVFSTAPSPSELLTIYSRGFRGIRKEAVSTDMQRRCDEMKAAMPSLYEAFPWAKGFGKGKISCPYYGQMQFDPEFGGDEAQTAGSCTVHGMGNACAIDYANDALFGETKYMGRLAYEANYRMRGYNSHGWSCYAPSMLANTLGLLYRKVYTGPNGEKVDLSRMNESWASNGKAGLPDWLKQEMAKNRCKLVILIHNMEEYRDAIAIGFGINVCSGQGFSSTTDENGVAAAQGSWSHAMAHVLCIDNAWSDRLYGGMVGGILQSWGNWNTQRGKPEGVARLAKGMFCAKGSVVNRMLGGGDDSYAMCNVAGWERDDWQIFSTTASVRDVVGAVTTHLRSSSVQDYYELRAKRSQQLTEKMYYSVFNTSL